LSRGRTISPGDKLPPRSAPADDEEGAKKTEKKGLKALRLYRETLRSLSSDQMERAAGAATLNIECYTYRCQNPTLTAGTNCCQ
jgi:hypothetical protein